MTAPRITFNRTDKPEFIKVLRKKVNQYFKENNISKYANFNMKFKTAFMLCLYFLPLIFMFTGIVSNIWLVMLMWVLMSFGMAGIGAGIMHDANHGSYSKNQSVNKVLGYLANFVGAYHINWKIQHNVLHHSFTNVEGYDGDINTPVMRFSPDQKKSKWYRFQAFYAPFFYGLMTINWIISKDFIQLGSYHKKNLLAGQGISLKKATLQVIVNKLWYLALTLVLPIILVPIAWWQVLLGFLLMHFICGVLLAFIFQPAHVVEETKFYTPNEKGSLENNWAIHQMETTSNFAEKSVFLSWFIGGLNFQIEHHLFPNICHVHYKKISKIIKETAKEFNVPYHQQNTFFDALRSHFILLHQLGTGRI